MRGWKSPASFGNLFQHCIWTLEAVVLLRACIIYNNQTFGFLSFVSVLLVAVGSYWFTRLNQPSSLSTCGPRVLDLWLSWQFFGGSFPLSRQSFWSEGTRTECRVSDARRGVPSLWFVLSTLTHILASTLDSWVFYSGAATQLAGPWPLLLHQVVLPQEQRLGLLLVEPHGVCWPKSQISRVCLVSGSVIHVSHSL